jgi:hypothetical protein
MKRIILSVILLFIVSCSAFKGRTTYETGTKIKLDKPGTGIYHGVFAGIDHYALEQSEKIINEYVSLSGSKPVWICFSDHWFEGIEFPAEKVELIWNLGYIPFIRIMPWSAYSDGVQDPVYTLDKIIKGDFNEELSLWGINARNSGIPLIIDFAPEMNGAWFPWSGSINGGGVKYNYGNSAYPDGPEKYIDAFKHIADMFNRYRVYNVTWVFHANFISVPDEEWNQPEYYYPGDDYIDWIGISVYGAQKPSDQWTSFSDVMEKAYPKMMKISSVKPCAIFEFGVIETKEEFQKSKWLEDTFNDLTTGKYPKIKAISYWNAKWTNADGSVSDMLINSSYYSLEAYKQGIQNKMFIQKPALIIR